MPTVLVKCGWCGSDKFPNELRRSEKLDAMVCPDCDCDNDFTLVEIEERKRQQAKDAAWNEGVGG